MGGVTVQSHNVGLTSYRLTSLSFPVNRPSHSWDTVFSKFDLGNQGSRSNDHDVTQLQVWTIPENFEWYRSIQGFQRYGFRKVWSKCCLIWQVFGPWASPYGANGLITITVHNYRSRQVHETLYGVNPSSGFRDMCSAKSGPNLCESFWPMGKPIWGKWLWRCTTTRQVNSIKLRMEKIHQAVTEIWVPQVWQPPARPPARTPGPWRQYPSSPEGWGVKRCNRRTDRAASKSAGDLIRHDT